MRGMEPLIELPRARWPALQQLCRGVWPQGLTAACILESYIRCPGLQQEFNFKVYCPGGDINSGMVATTDSNKEYLDLMIHPLPDGMTALENALLTTSIIDRKRPILVSAASIEVTTILDRIKDRIAVSVFYDESCKAVKHILGRQSRHFENLSCPAHTYLGTLKPEHLAAVDKTWTYHNSSTHKYFQALIQYELTYALYSESHKPLAWVTVNSEGALTHLFCVEEHRRRGYAEFITKIAINDLLSKGPPKAEHIPLVDKTWEFHSNVSHQYFKTMMQHDLFYVLYNSDDQPLAWVAVNPEGTLTHLYCLEEHRRKGYAEFITRTAANDLLKRDRDVLAYTIENNEKPKKLFAKLGFEVVEQAHWVVMKKTC